MHPRLVSLIAIAAGTTLACPSAALAHEPILAPDAPMRARIGGYVYINARTGERTVSTSPSPTRDDRVPHFVNEDTWNSNNYWFWGVDNPTQTFPTTVGGGPRIGGEAASWGDIDFDTRIDAFTFSYATTICPEAQFENLAVNLWWFDCDGGRNDTAANPLWGIHVDDLEPGDCTIHSDAITGWVYTVDVAGTDLEFEIGDTDGSFTGITGTSSTGCDKDDADGSPKADFGWSYTFDQSGTAQPPGVIGPFLVLAASADTYEDDHVPTGATGNADGVPDNFDFYKNPSGGLRELHAGTYNFGGWPAAPYASFWLGLYGPEGPDCAPADYNADTLVDILDFLDFIDDFSNCENQPAPCGSVADADLTGDTIVDILDFLGFFDLFGQCE